MIFITVFKARTAPSRKLRFWSYLEEIWPKHHWMFQTSNLSCNLQGVAWETRKLHLHCWLPGDLTPSHSKPHRTKSSAPWGRGAGLACGRFKRAKRGNYGEMEKSRPEISISTCSEPWDKLSAAGIRWLHCHFGAPGDQADLEWVHHVQGLLIGLNRKSYDDSTLRSLNSR